MTPKWEFHPPHIYANNACYFVTASTAHHQKLFDTLPKRTLLHNTLKTATEDYDIQLYAWVILVDHYHLLLKTGETIPLYKFIKRLHGESAIQLNKIDRTPGRKVWYQYWDRFPRNEKDFWGYFNYIHINPIKHHYVSIRDDNILRVEGKLLKFPKNRTSDIHACLAEYPYSSYSYYLKQYGEAFLDDAWLYYPIPDYLANDDF